MITGCLVSPFFPPFRFTALCLSPIHQEIQGFNHWPLSESPLFRFQGLVVLFLTTQKTSPSKKTVCSLFPTGPSFSYPLPPGPRCLPRISFTLIRNPQRFSFYTNDNATLVWESLPARKRNENASCIVFTLLELKSFFPL